jgi:shikimate kinase
VLLILLGLRASGKSSVGPLLAARTGGAFIDLDHRTLVRLNAASVQEAWHAHGEKAFREAEAGALREVLHDQIVHAVIALGGGTPTAPGVASLLLHAQDQGRATLVYLRAHPETLQSRLRACQASDRPGITGDDPIAEVPLLFMKRDPLYMHLARVVVGVDDATPEQAADVIAKRLALA